MVLEFQIKANVVLQAKIITTCLRNQIEVANAATNERPSERLHADRDHPSVLAGT